jgi:hypothetical protein
MRTLGMYYTHVVYMNFRKAAKLDIFGQQVRTTESTSNDPLALGPGSEGARGAPPPL